MVSAAFCWRDGTRLWNVTHEGDKGVRNLEVEGQPPIELAALRATAEAAQRQERKFPFLPFRWGIDYYFRVPLDLAASIVGFEHDRNQYSWGKPTFEPLAEGAVS